MECIRVYVLKISVSLYGRPIRHMHIRMRRYLLLAGACVGAWGVAATGAASGDLVVSRSSAFWLAALASCGPVYVAAAFMLRSQVCLG